jgi:hypothetical protein
MNFAKTPSGPAEFGRPLATEAEGNIRSLPRGMTGFRQPSQTDGEAAPESLNNCPTSGLGGSITTQPPIW